MSTDRREFLGGLLAVGVLGKTGEDRGRLGKGSSPVSPGFPPSSPGIPLQGSSWDVSWVDRLKGSRRAVFDSPEVSQGLALIRSLVWFRDYAEIYGTPAADMSLVLVIRHGAIWMIMNDEFWDHHKIGALVKIDDPKTGRPIRRNPFLGPTPYADLPPQIADEVLKKVLATATVLACNLAFRAVVEKIKDEAGGDMARARSMALEHVVPGIILQPSGVFAVTRAQEAGCHYFLAS